MIKRDLNNAVVAGVCAGLANYLGIDPVFVRLAFILSVLVYGVGFLPYFILWLIMPSSY